LCAREPRSLLKARMKEKSINHHDSSHKKQNGLDSHCVLSSQMETELWHHHHPTVYQSENTVGGCEPQFLLNLLTVDTTQSSSVLRYHCRRNWNIVNNTKSHEGSNEEFHHNKSQKMAPVAPRPTLPLAFKTSCKCGKVCAAINALEKLPPLRLVCYCKDCRGYFETLNRIAASDPATKTNPSPAQLDNWGGVDWTAVYPRDITILQGQDLLATTKIREGSSMRQVYTTCCYTPLFRFGNLSVLANSNTLKPSEGQDEELPVSFRIIGRDAWKQGKESAEKPIMSFSVPFKWFWTMPFRINKEYMQPMPLALPATKDCKVLSEFKEGSSTYE
jgi:hypothetical protein